MERVGRVGLAENVLKYFGSHMNFPTLHNPRTRAMNAKDIMPEATSSIPVAIPVASPRSVV